MAEHPESFHSKPSTFQFFLEMRIVVRHIWTIDQVIILQRHRSSQAYKARAKNDQHTIRVNVEGQLIIMWNTLQKTFYSVRRLVYQFSDYRRRVPMTIWSIFLDHCFHYNTQSKQSLIMPEFLLFLPYHKGDLKDYTHRTYTTTFLQVNHSRVRSISGIRSPTQTVIQITQNHRPNSNH